MGTRREGKSGDLITVVFAPEAQIPDRLYNLGEGGVSQECQSNPTMSWLADIKC